MSEPGFASERAWLNGKRTCTIWTTASTSPSTCRAEEQPAAFFSRAQCKFLPFLSTDLQFQDELRHRL